MGSRLRVIADFSTHSIGIGIWPLEGIDGKNKWRRTIFEIEGDGIRARVGETLIGEHGEILGDHVTKERAENSDIEASSIAGADYRLRVELIGDADTRSKILEVFRSIHRCVIRAVTRHVKCTGRQIGEAALPCSVDRLGEVNLPAQAQVESQVGRQPPSVLDITEDDLLRFFCIC